MKVLIAHYSLLRHTNRLAEAVIHGAKEIEGAEVKLMRVPEILAEEKITRRGAVDFRKSAYPQLSSFYSLRPWKSSSPDHSHCESLQSSTSFSGKGSKKV